MTWWHYDRSEAQLNRQAGNVARFIDLVRERYGYETHAQFGALLGIVREQDFIRHDKDLDFCFMLNGTDRASVYQEMLDFYKQLDKDGLLIKVFEMNGKPFGQAYVWADDFVIDTYIAWVEDGQLMTCQWGNFGKAEQFLPTVTGKLRGHDIPIPQNHDKILTRLYGNWRTPSKDHPKKRLSRLPYLHDT
jgi:phosphorylcholine metabolism protein LicD